MWLCIFSCRQFEDTFENTHRRKVKQMQPMWLFILSGRQFEETFKNAQWRKVKKCSQCDLSSFMAANFRRHLEMHSGEKSNRCNRCDFVSSRADNLRGAPNSKFLEKSRDFVSTSRGGGVNESQVYVTLKFALEMSINVMKQMMCKWGDNMGWNLRFALERLRDNLTMW